MRNTQIKKSLNRKMCPQYLSPLIVISRNLGGAYISTEQYSIDTLPPSNFYPTSLEKPFPFPNILSTSTPPDSEK
jgi:hypothetical protein